MFGVEGVMTALEARLRDAMPAKLQELRERYDIVDGSLEDITRYLTAEPDNVSIDKPPMIVIAEQQSDTLTGVQRHSGDGSGGATYKYRYTLLVFVWARGRNFTATGKARRLYALAAREVLLQMPGLGADGDPGSILLIPESLVENYSDITRDGESREVIAATAIELQYETQEHLSPRLPSRGTASFESTTGVQ